MHIVDVQMTLLDLIGQKHSGEKPLDGVSHWAHIKAGVNKSGKIKFGAKSNSRAFRAIRSRTQRGKNFSRRSELLKEAPRKEILEWISNLNCHLIIFLFLNSKLFSIFKPIFIQSSKKKIHLSWISIDFSCVKITAKGQIRSTSLNTLTRFFQTRGLYSP